MMGKFVFKPLPVNISFKEVATNTPLDQKTNQIFKVSGICKKRHFFKASSPHRFGAQENFTFSSL